MIKKNTVVNIQFKFIDDIRSFNNAISRRSFSADLASGKYTVDAKSIMGIYSLDSSKVLNLTIYADGPEVDNFLDEIKGIIVS